MLILPRRISLSPLILPPTAIRSSLSDSMPTPLFPSHGQTAKAFPAARPEPHRPGPACSRFAPAGSEWSSTRPGINTSPAICPTPKSRIVSTKFSRAYPDFKPNPSSNFARKSHKVSNPFQKFLGSWGYLRHLQDVFLLVASSRPHPPSFLDDDTIRGCDLSVRTVCRDDISTLYYVLFTILLQYILIRYLSIVESCNPYNSCKISSIYSLCGLRGLSSYIE
jgi:hypothetical protein